MDIKKQVFIFAFIVLLLSPNLISAADFGVDIRRGSENIINFVVEFASPFLQIILGGEDYTVLLLFERLLIFIILLSLLS